jgi:hypothetical protein
VKWLGRPFGGWFFWNGNLCHKQKRNEWEDDGFKRKASSYYFKSDENSSVGNGDFHVGVQRLMWVVQKTTTKIQTAHIFALMMMDLIPWIIKPIPQHSENTVFQKNPPEIRIQK